MSRQWWGKVLLVNILVLLSFIYLIPSFCKTESWPSWVQKIMPRNKLQLGLDLQGGLHLVMGIDSEEVVGGKGDLLVEEIKTVLEAKVPGATVQRASGSSMKVTFKNTED